MKFSINKTKEALGELQTTLHWIVTIVSPASVVGEFPEELQIRVQSAAVPESDEQSTQVELQGHLINFSGKTIKAGTLDWTFVEGTDAKVTNYFTRWAAARWSGDGQDTTGAQALTKDLKADVKMELLGPDDKVTQTYTLIGSMPKIARGVALSQTADGVFPVVTWEYDDFHYLGADGTTW